MNLQWKLDIVRKQMPPQGQTQVALIDQLELMQAVANHLGCYDAADFIQRAVESRPLWIADRDKEP